MKVQVLKKIRKFTKDFRDWMYTFQKPLTRTETQWAILAIFQTKNSFHVGDFSGEFLTCETHSIDFWDGFLEWKIPYEEYFDGFARRKNFLDGFVRWETPQMDSLYAELSPWVSSMENSAD